MFSEDVDLLSGRSRRNFLRASARFASVAAAGVTLSSTGTKAALAAVQPRCEPAHPERCCFLRGTSILTADGYRKIEDLKVGEKVSTAFGGLQPIQWISHNFYTRTKSADPWVESVRPIRIAASAISPGVPFKDLYLTAAHALMIDDVLVRAETLVNGTTITVDDAVDLDAIEYFHVKVAAHDIIDANGMACETLLGCNEFASNFAEYLREFGPVTTDAVPCLPILAYNGGRQEVASYVRSALSPWIDVRRKLDVIRDRIEERGLSMARKKELA